MPCLLPLTSQACPGLCYSGRSPTQQPKVEPRLTEPCGFSEAWRPSRLGTPTEEPSLHPFTGHAPGARLRALQAQPPLCPAPRPACRSHCPACGPTNLPRPAQDLGLGWQRGSHAGMRAGLPASSPSLLYSCFLRNKGLAGPGSSRCCSIEISRWFSINHSLWCLRGQEKESNKASFLSRKGVPAA